MFLNYWKIQNLVGLRNWKFWLDNPMTNLPKEMVGTASSLQKWSCKVWFPWSHNFYPKFSVALSCSPRQIHQQILACHTSLERSRIAFYGYANLWSPNQTIWWLEALKATQRWPWFAYIGRQNENFWHWVKSSTSLAFRKTWCHT